MTCYHPIPAQQYGLTKNGKAQLIFKNHKEFKLHKADLQVPCGQCIGCRLERSRQWAVRISHEATLYTSNCFITLTYDDNHLPWDHSLNLNHFQLFMKRLRKQIEPKKIRFFHAGEYGYATPENNFIARPHYHAIIFNHHFDDQQPFLEREGVYLYTSDRLNALWGLGINNSVGAVTFESAAYVARYCLKKINGHDAHEHYTRTDFTTGEVLHLQPEYATMSRGGKSLTTNLGGIGKQWFDRFSSDCYPSDSIHIRGVKQKPPKYYDYLYDLDPIADLDLIKQNRRLNAEKHENDNTPERLASRELVKQAQTNQLQRTL